MNYAAAIILLPDFRSPRKRLWALGLILLLAFAPGCGTIGPVPKVLQAEQYTEVSVSQLAQPAAAGLRGRLVKFPAFFWEVLSYDPAFLSNLTLLAAHPVQWWSLGWAAVYESPQMQGHYDRLALDQEQLRRLKFKRLAPVMVYGEVTPMGPVVTYVRVHRMEEQASD